MKKLIVITVYVISCLFGFGQVNLKNDFFVSGVNASTPLKIYEGAVLASNTTYMADAQGDRFKVKFTTGESTYSIALQDANTIKTVGDVNGMFIGDTYHVTVYYYDGTSWVTSTSSGNVNYYLDLHYWKHGCENELLYPNTLLTTYIHAGTSTIPNIGWFQQDVGNVNAYYKWVFEPTSGGSIITTFISDPASPPLASSIGLTLGKTYTITISGFIDGAWLVSDQSCTAKYQSILQHSKEGCDSQTMEPYSTLKVYEGSSTNLAEDVNYHMQNTADRFKYVLTANSTVNSVSALSPEYMLTNASNGNVAGEIEWLSFGEDYSVNIEAFDDATNTWMASEISCQVTYQHNLQFKSASCGTVVPNDLPVQAYEGTVNLSNDAYYLSLAQSNNIDHIYEAHFYQGGSLIASVDIVSNTSAPTFGEIPELQYDQTYDLKFAAYDRVKQIWIENDIICSVTMQACPGALTSVITTTAPLCTGQTNGEINLTISGGLSPYAYLWNADISTSLPIASTENNPKGLESAIYAVTVTGAKGCLGSFDGISLTDPTLLHPTFIDVPISHAGAENGSLALSLGGTPPYTYLWTNNIANPSQTTPSITGLASATYNVVVTDANGCTAANTYQMIEGAVLAQFSDCGSTYLDYELITQGYNSLKPDGVAAWEYYLFEFSLDASFSSLEHNSAQTIPNSYTPSLDAGWTAWFENGIAPEMSSVTNLGCDQTYYVRVRSKQTEESDWTIPGPTCTIQLSCEEQFAWCDEGIYLDASTNTGCNNSAKPDGLANYAYYLFEFSSDANFSQLAYSGSNQISSTDPLDASWTANHENGTSLRLSTISNLKCDQRYFVRVRVKNKASDPWSLPGYACTIDTYCQERFIWCDEPYPLDGSVNTEGYNSGKPDGVSDYEFYLYEFSEDANFSQLSYTGESQILSTEELDPMWTVNYENGNSVKIGTVPGLTCDKRYYVRIRVKNEAEDPWSRPGPVCYIDTYCHERFIWGNEAYDLVQTFNTQGYNATKPDGQADFEYYLYEFSPDENFSKLAYKGTDLIAANAALDPMWTVNHENGVSTPISAIPQLQCESRYYVRIRVRNDVNAAWSLPGPVSYLDIIGSQSSCKAAVVRFVHEQSYATLSRTLNAGYYTTKNGKLAVKYNGEYNAGELEYKIYSQFPSNPELSSELSTGLPIVTKQLGDNRYNFDVGSYLAVGFYTLEITNEKNEKYRLRFENVTSTLTSGSNQ